MKTKSKLFAVFATLLFLALANKASADGVCEWTKKDSSTGEITTGRAVLTADLLARTTNETSGTVDEASCKSYIEHLRDEDAHTNTFTFTRFIENAKQANNTTPEATTPTSTTGTFSYQLLEAIPGIFSKGATPDFNTYVSGIYKFLILIVGICALFMITVGGYMYITSAGNTASMGKARSIIFDAIIGLVLALLAYLIFYTINPNLTSPTGLQPISVIVNTVTNGGTASTIKGGNIPSDSRAPGIPVTSSKQCTNPNTSGCTYTAGLPDSIISTVKKINDNYPIVISGAAETAGHTSHGPGKPMVDIQPQNGNYDELGAYLTQNRESLGIKQICTTPQYAKYRFNCDYNESANHFHITGV